jgi:hypothetical protein
MARCLSLYGITALLSALGCLPGAFVVQSPEVEPGRLIVQDSVAHVSGNLWEELSDLGILVIPKRVGQDQRLAGMTKSGKAYCLHLRPGKDGNGEITVVSIQWGGDPDAKFWQTVIKLLKAHDKTAGFTRMSVSPPS